MEEQYTLEEFGQFIKDSYPEYANVDNVVLAEKMLVKYPEYANRIVGSEPLKKKEDTLPLESPSATDSTAPTSPSVPKQPDALGDSVSTVADPSKLTPAQQADIQTAAMELEPQVETETTYMAPVTADPVTSPTAEQALTAAMATRAESIEMGVDEQTVFEGTVSEYLLDMDGLEKERMSRIAGGESFFLDEEAGNFSLEFDEQYRAQAEDSRKSLMLIEDDIVKVATTPILSALPPEDRINQVRDLKEQYLQSIPADFRARVEAMDLDEFVDYSLQNAQKRNFAEAYVGMSNLQDYDLEVMSGKMQGAMAAQMKKEDVDGSWVGERFAAPWSDFIGGFDGLMFGKSKSGVEAYDKDLEDINYILASYEDKPTDEQLIEIGKMRYRPEGQLGSLDYELNKKLGKPSSLYTNDAFFKQKGEEAVKLGKSYFEDLREKVQVGRNSHNDVAKLYAQSFNYDGSFRDVTSSLIDEKVLTEEQMQKTPWQNFADGDVKAFGYQSLGHVFDLMPDMVKAFGATYIGGPQAMAAMFGTGAASQTTGEYASRPDVSGVEAIEVGFRAGAIEAGVTSFFAGLQVAQVGLARAVQEGAKQGVKKSSLQAGKQVVGDFLETTKGKTIRNWFGEGSEEGFIATFDQINRITSEVASGRMNTQEAVDEYFNPAAIGDAFYAGFLGGGVGSSPFVLAKGFSAIGSKFSLFDRLELKDRQDFLFEQLSRTDITAEERKGLRAELTKLHEDANRLARKDVEFYEQMEEEDLKELTRLNQEISNKRRKARQLAREEGTTSETRLQSLANDVRGLMQQKLEIENKYDSAMEGYDLDVEAQTRNDAEVDRLVDDILNVDREWDGLSDEVGEDASKSSGKIRLTGKNADSLLGRLLAGEIKGTKYATAEQIVDGIKNAFKMAKAVIADNPDAEVILVNSKEAYLREVEKADGKRPQKVSRGVHVSRDGGTMVLYAPALKTNTGYHEGFHQMVYRMMKGDGVDRGEAMLRLASALRRGMTKRQLQRYGNFLNQYGQLTDAGRAEEFLAELWSDITDGEVDIQFHKGIVSGWLRFVNQGLARKGLKVSGAPVLQDVVTGLKDAAEFFALGEGGAQESLSLAFDAAGKLRPGLNREGLLNRLELRRYRRNQRMSQATLVSAEDDRLKSQALVTAETSDFKVVRPGRDNKSNARRLASVMSEAIKQHNRLKTGVSIQVTPLNAAQIEAMMDDGTVFLEGTNAMEGGAIGYVEKNGYFGGLVKNPTYEVGGVQKALTLAAVENGATHLECYATFLEGNNINMGFAPVARIAFNEEFAPEGWDSEQSSIKDKPDIVFMAFDPVSAADSKPGDGIKLDDYGAALARTRENADGEGSEVKAQELAIDRINQELPSKTTQTLQVARVLNSFSGEIVQEEGELIKTFLDNVYEEAGFYLQERDARTSGLTWYTEDIQEMKDKLAIIFPALESPDMSTIASAVLALTSSGTSPIQNMLTTVAILRNTPIDQQRSGNFSRNWGGDKMSFVGKNGKSIASGRIVKEGKTYFVVQNVNPLGKDTKGLVKIKKSELKKGYPKPTGYTARGKIVEAQLNKIQALFEKFKTPKAVVEFLTTDQPIQVLREYNKSVPDTKGKVNKNPAPGRRKGAYILGEKIGSFFLNIEGVGETLTADLWFNRTWNRYMGTMISTVKGVDVIQEVPRSEAERGIMTSAVAEAANELGLTVAELQATMWYFEQELWRRMGANSRSENFVMAIDNVASRLDLSNDTRKRLEEAGVNLDRAEEKRETAVSRANDKVSEESTTKEQALEDYLDQQEQDVSELKEQAQGVRIERQEDMGRFRGAMLDMMEFLYDKFYKAIRYQKEIEKGLNARVMREQDYDMALALLDGKASRRLQSVDSFMEDVAAVMNRHGITYDELGDFLYAMHAENRNEVLLERFEKKQQKLAEQIAKLSEESDSKDATEEERRATSKKLKDLREELSDVESRIEKKNFSGKTNEEARADIERLDSEGMREAYDLVMDFQKETRKLIVEYGLETQTTVDKLEALYPSYVPLSGFAIDEDAGSEALEAGYLHMHQARVFRGIRRAEGRSSKAQNPLDYIFERRYQTVMAGEKNSANIKLLNLLVDNPEPSLYKVYGPKDKLPTQKGKRKGMSKGEARNNESFVEVVVNGESFFIEFSNASVARAVNKHNITKLDAHPYVQTVFNFIRSFGRYLSATFTSYSPDFVGSNFVRDLQFGMSSLLAEQEIPGGQAYGERIALNSAKKITGSMRFLYGNFMGKTQDKSDPMYEYWQEFQDYGAITDWPYAKNTDVLRNDMETLTRMQDPSLSRRAAVGAVDGLRAVARYVNNVNMTVENATRFAVFQAARDAGVDAEQAAFLAKELTINFNRSGSGGSVINAIYLFFNAGVQGTSKFIRTIGTLRKVPDGRGGYYRQLNSAQKVAMGMSFFSVAQAALNQAISEEDEDGRTFYEKIPDYVKERNMVFMLPNATGTIEGQDYIKIPLPYGYNIFHNVGTMAYEASVGMRTPGDAAMFMVGGMANSFIPISFGQSSDAARGFAKAFSPTFFRPMTEIIVNESYYGTPVYNNNFPGQNLPASSLASRSPEWMKDAASFLNEATGGNEFEAGYLDGNPDKLWHVFEYYGGGAYRFGKNTFNTLEEPIKHIQGLSDSEARESAGKALSTAPVARIFYGTTNDRQDVADYYEFRGKVRSAAQAQKELGLQEEKYINSVQLNEIGKATDRQLRRIRRDIKASEKIEDPVKKSRDINQLYNERMQIIKSFNKQYLQYYEGRKKD